MPTDQMTLSPACPYCGEQQRKSEARPSKPFVVTRGGKRFTDWNDECRACGQRIIFGMTLGTARYHWSKP